MIATGASRVLLAAAGCLVLASCTTAKSSAAPAGATTAVTSSGAASAPSAATSPATTSAADPASTTAAAVSGGSGVTACGLITEQDASAALGRAAGNGTAGGTAALSECIYDSGSLIVSMKADSKALYDSAYTQAKAKGATSVPSVGDSAFQYGTGATFSGVEFVKGTTLVSIIAGGTGAPGAALAAAKVAASKL
jgi:hypothetical protein